MYVDKKLGGVNAVQTLSRLNRTHPEKQDTMVLDFANDADGIKAAFEPNYETTLLSEATDPNLLYEIQSRLEAFPVYAQSEVDAFARVCFDSKVKQDRLYSVLDLVFRRFKDLHQDERQGFRGQLTSYVRLQAFLAQVLTFADADLEKLHVFARHLCRPWASVATLLRPRSNPRSGQCSTTRRRRRGPVAKGDISALR